MANAVKDNNYFTICGFMTAKNRLALSGVKLLVYAIIYGFTQDGKNACEASLDYISDFVGADESNVRRSLKALTESGLIYKENRNTETGKTNTYRANLEILDFSKPVWNFGRVGQNAQGGECKTPTPVGQNAQGGECKTPTPVGQNAHQYYNIYPNDDIITDKKERKKENIEIHSSIDFGAMSDEDLIEWGQGKGVDWNDENQVRNFYAYSDEVSKRGERIPRWTGKIVRQDGSLKRLESHDEIMTGWGLSDKVKEKMREFLRYCYANGKLVTNGKLESILFELTGSYPSDKDKCEAIEKAINGGYFDIKRYSAL